MMIWINGAFGAGKTTLAEELHQRLPDALAFDPEYVGYILNRWVPAPDSTLILRGDQLTPAQLADLVVDAL
jgi:adenylate kinase family enzyme